MPPYLPAELLRAIFTNMKITRDDLKSLRLVSKSWTDVATDLLFYRICLSRLKLDRDSFFNIAAHPHLAKCARVLVWYELGSDIPCWYLPDPFSSIDNPTEPFQSLDEDPDTQFFYHKLLIQIRNLFWFSLQTTFHEDANSGDAVNREMDKLKDFMALF